MAPLQYAVVIIKTFTQYSVWSYHWKADSYPKQFLFSSRNTHRGLTCASRTMAERSGQSPSVRLEGRWKEVLQTHALNNPINILGTWDLNAHVRQAVGWLEVGNPAQIKQWQPHTVFLKVCSEQHWQYNGPRGPWSLKCSEAPRGFSCPLP